MITNLDNANYSKNIERIVLESNIKMFNENILNPELNIKTNLIDAFNFRRTAKQGGGQFIFTGQTMGGGLASVSVVNQTNNNTVSVNVFKSSINMYSLSYDVVIDIRQVNNGEISVEKAVSKTSQLLNMQAITLMFSGVFYDAEKKNNLMLIENNLYDCGTPLDGVNVGLTTATVNSVTAMFMEMADNIYNSGSQPEVLFLSRKAYSKILNLKKDMGQEGVFKVLKDAYNIDVYVSPLFDSIRGDGAVAIMTTRSEDSLQAVFGHEAYLPHGSERRIEGANIIYTIDVTAGGFATKDNNRNIVQIRKKLLG